MKFKTLNAFVSATKKHFGVRTACKARQMKMLSPLPGGEIGIPLNMIQNVFTNLHYGYDISSVKSCLLQFLIGYYTYSKDRYKDAFEYRDNVKCENNEKCAELTVSKRKIELYDYLLEYDTAFALSYDFAFAVITYILLIDSPEAFPFWILLYSSEYYKELKRTLPLLKSVYVSSMWTASSVLLPCVLHDHNYSILWDFNDYLPCFFAIFAFTNVADMYDVDEDRINAIDTFPVKYGIEVTAISVQLALLFSSFIFGLNEHYYDRPVVNSLFEIQNALFSVYVSFLYISLQNSEAIE